MRPTTGLLSYGPFERAMWLWGRDGLILGRLGDLPGRNGPSRLLDVGCGAGMLVITATQMGFDVSAIDTSEKMMERLTSSAAVEAPGSRISAFVGDGQTLENFSGESFEVVSSTFGIAIFPDRVAGWKAALRVLVPGGRLVASSWDTASANARMFGYVLAKAKDVETHESKPESPQNPPSPNRTMQAASFREELQECGFTHVHIHVVNHPIAFASGEELLEDVLASEWACSVLAHKDPASVQRTMLDYVQLLLDHEDPFTPNAASKIHVAADVPAQSHPLWTEPFVLHGLGYIAVATKP